MRLDAFGHFRKISEMLLEKYVFRNFCEVSEKLEAWDRLYECDWPAPRPVRRGERCAANHLDVDSWVG